MNYDLLIINADIDYPTIHEVLRLDKATVAPRILMIINTRGGNPFVAYRTMQHLGALYKKIDVVIPDIAMSAGTLMCMGADRIFMHTGSSLGPLDLQVSHPNDGGQISSLDIKESTYDIFALTTKVTKQLFAQAVNDMKLGKNYAAKIAHESAVELLKPMVDKIDPYHLHASYRGASIGQKYAYILLASRMMKDRPQKAAETSRILAEDYEMHGYAITTEEATDYLGLNVFNIADLDVLQQLKLTLGNLPQGIAYRQIRTPAPRAEELQKIKNKQLKKTEEKSNEAVPGKEAQ